MPNPESLLLGPSRKIHEDRVGVTIHNLGSPFLIAVDEMDSLNPSIQPGNSSG